MIVFGSAFVAAYDQKSGAEVYESSLTEMGNIIDVKIQEEQKLVASKTEINRITAAGPEKIFKFSDVKYGNFLEFINGDEYYIEKEGFFIPLNFINDKVIYFKTDNDKVYGLDNNEIEYEYHFTELYKDIGSINDKKVIGQRKNSLLISSNYEKLASFNRADKVVSLNSRVYFVDGNRIHIVDVEHLK